VSPPPAPPHSTRRGPATGGHGEPTVEEAPPLGAAARREQAWSGETPACISPMDDTGSGGVHPR